jgi:hypothetical protein
MAMYVTFDRSPIHDELVESSIKVKDHMAMTDANHCATIEQLVESVYYRFRDIENSVLEIEREAEQNLDKFKASK